MAMSATSKTKTRKKTGLQVRKVQQDVLRRPISSSGEYRMIGSLGYNGEKSAGEIGPIKDYTMDYNGLRSRSWQSFVESEITALVIRQYCKWVIGSGLKLQAEPEADILKDFGINIDKQKWSKMVESRFRLYCKSRMSDWADMTSLNIMENEAFKNTLVGGDVLVVLRYDFKEKQVKVRLIDGAHVQSPRGNNLIPIKLENGNKIYWGVEVNKKGQHVAYHVRKPGDFGFMAETERIPARGSESNALMAYMVYGSKYRVDSYRGMPLISVVLETLKKLERYKEATVGGAEERQKIAYFFEHKMGSTGENPLTAETVKARDLDLTDGDGMRLVPIDDYGNSLADRFGATTGKTTINMPIESSIKALEAKQEIAFKDFYSTNLMVVCAALDIPYEVAMSMFNSNYSASRGAIKVWEQTMKTCRDYFAMQFMQPIYDFWLECEVLTGRISAPGYLKALIFTDDRVALEAFRNARYVGPNVPHIDPEKEVKAERLKLGLAGLDVPLTTVENATENLDGGDADSNMEQFAAEMNKKKSLGIKVDVPPPAPGGAAGNKPAKKKPA